MFVAFQMEATVDKKVGETVRRSRGGAQEYFAGGFGKREGEHVGYVVAFFSFDSYSAHLCGSDERDRELVLFSEHGVFYCIKRFARQASARLVDSEKGSVGVSHKELTARAALAGEALDQFAEFDELHDFLAATEYFKRVFADNGA